jgi:hypothetical protein
MYIKWAYLKVGVDCTEYPEKLNLYIYIYIYIYMVNLDGKR